MKYFSIGKVKIKKTAALAPMASVADRAYRTLCREYGACYTVSELISAKGLCYNDKKTAELCTVTDGERRNKYNYKRQIFQLCRCHAGNDIPDPRQPLSKAPAKAGGRKRRILRQAGDGIEGHIEGRIPNAPYAAAAGLVRPRLLSPDTKALYKEGG